LEQLTPLGWRLRRAVRGLLPRKMHPWHGWPDDVYIVSYPRLGYTWLRRLLAHVLEPNRDWDVTVLALVVPDVYGPRPQGWIERRPHIVRSYEPYQPSYQRVIYLYRDGRDVAVSYYDYPTKVHGYRGSFAFSLRSSLLADYHMVRGRATCGPGSLRSIQSIFLLLGTRRWLLTL